MNDPLAGIAGEGVLHSTASFSAGKPDLQILYTPFIST